LTFFAGYKVLSSESNMEQLNDTYIYNGRVDCILEKNNETVIVDFKKSYDFKIKDYTGEKGLVDFQLPLYMRLAESKTGKVVNTSLFFTIHDPSPLVLFGFVLNIATKETVPLKAENIFSRDGEICTGIMNQLNEKSEKFTEEISKASYSLLPDKRQLCAECEYKKVCRTMYRILPEKIYE